MHALNSIRTSIAPFCLFVGALLAATCLPSWAEEAPKLSPVAEAGRSYFLESCASCHGDGAHGDGPTAASLSTKPADLTLISKRRDGKFPTGELAEMIDGRNMVAAHGNREMPIWGERFSEEEEGDSMTERLVQGRIMMLLVYLRAIQQ
jgi:mono/diheme cytochrome c family protein